MPCYPLCLIGQGNLALWDGWISGISFELQTASLKLLMSRNEQVQLKSFVGPSRIWCWLSGSCPVSSLSSVALAEPCWGGQLGWGVQFPGQSLCHCLPSQKRWMPWGLPCNWRSKQASRWGGRGLSKYSKTWLTSSLLYDCMFFSGLSNSYFKCGRASADHGCLRAVNMAASLSSWPGIRALSRVIETHPLQCLGRGTWVC